jgi:hypothetical protein
MLDEIQASHTLGGAGKCRVQGMLIISSDLASLHPASSGLAGWSDASPYQGVRGI